MEIQELFQQMAEDKGPKKPRKQRITHIYSRDYFDTKVKATFEVLWAQEQKRPLEPGEKPVKRLDYSNKVTAQHWEAESPDFKAWLETIRVAEHRKAIEEWEVEIATKVNADKQTPTAESYQKYVSKLVWESALISNFSEIWRARPHSCNHSAI